MVNLDNKANKIVANSLRFVSENANIDDDGRVSIELSIEYYAAFELLLSHIPDRINYPESIKRTVLFRALKRWVKYKKYRNNPDLEMALQEAFTKELDLLERKIKTFTVLMFINADYQTLERLGDFSAIDSTLRLKNWNELSELDMNEFWRQMKIEDKDGLILRNIESYQYPNQNNYTPITIDTLTYSHEAAVEIANKKIDLLRGFINTSLLIFEFTYHRSIPKALSKLLPTPIYGVFGYDKKFIILYHTVEKYSYKKFRIGENRVGFFRRLIEHYLSSADNELVIHLVQVIQQYQKALDMNNQEIAYLAMWRVLEFGVSFGEIGVDVEKRVKTLLRLPPVLKDALKLIGRQRNLMVHSGIFPSDSDKIFFILKEIVDHLIYKLIHLSHNYNSLSELKEYLALSSLGDNDLNRKQSVIERIISSRQ